MIREWNADDARQELEFEIKDQQFDLRMYAVTYSPTKDLIATAQMDGKIRVWNADDWSIRTTIDVPGSFRFGGLQFAKDGMWLTAGAI